MMMHNKNEPRRYLPWLAVSLALLGHGTAIGALMMIDRSGEPQLPTQVLSARIVIERSPDKTPESETVVPPDTPAPQPKVVNTEAGSVKIARYSAPKVEAVTKRVAKRTSKVVRDKATHDAVVKRTPKVEVVKRTPKVVRDKTTRDVAQPAKSETPALAPEQPAGVTSRPAKSTQDLHKSPPVVAPRFEADYLSNPAPRYPRKSRYLGEEGRVLLKVRVSESGDALEVSLHTSSGFKRLDRAALDAVQQWKFIPARQGRKQVMAWVVVPLEFSLRRTL